MSATDQNARIIADRTGCAADLEEEIVRSLGVKGAEAGGWTAVSIPEEVIAEDIGAAGDDQHMSVRTWAEAVCLRHRLLCSYEPQRDQFTFQKRLG